MFGNILFRFVGVDLLSKNFFLKDWNEKNISLPVPHVYGL